MADTFGVLLNVLIPLYVLIALGFVSGRFFNVERQTLGALGIYIFLPIIAFGFVGQMELKLEYIILPILFFTLQAISTFVWFCTGKAVYGDARANLVGLCTSAGNTGYFGLPIALALFPAEWVAVYIFIMIGGAVYESTIMYYLAARGQFSVKDSLIKLAKFPSLYAIVAGIFYNLSGAGFSDMFLTYWGYVKGAYVVIGMMMIGCALSRVHKLVWAPRFITMTFLGKFVMFPAMSIGLILADLHYFHMFAPEIHKIFYILSIVPTAANVAAFAIEMNLRPEKTASTILYGTLAALFYIPAAIMIYDQFIVVTP